MAVAVPNIGSRVRVTTMYPNTYAYRGEYDNYVTYTREGVVVQSIFRDPFMFAVETGAADHPVSEFNAKSQHVVKIEYLVQRVNGKFSCTCKGFEFRKDCKHIAAVGKK